MSTAIEGLLFNPKGWLPIEGATVVAQSTDGFSEGSDTTDSNGHFAITGLTNRNWMAKTTAVPRDFGVVLLLPNTVFHDNLSSVLADQHHAGFVALVDNADIVVSPDANDRIKITDDGVINADAAGGDGGILALTINQAQIDHGSIGGLNDDDHSQYPHGSGRSGGQIITGGVDGGDTLSLQGTFHDTKGFVYIGGEPPVTFTMSVDETTGQIAIPTAGASAGILIGGDALWYRSAADTMRTPDAVTIDGQLTLSGTLATLTTRGDLLYAGADAALTRLAVGADGEVLRSDGTDPVWEDDDYTIQFIIDGGGSAITTGQKGHAEVPASGVIEGWTILADQSGSIVVDVWKDTYANFPPTVADTIAGSEKPTLSTAQKNQDLALGTWTTTVTKGDIIAFNVDSITTVERVLVSIRVRKT
jgi:hypothetical protein